MASSEGFRGWFVEKLCSGCGEGIGYAQPRWFVEFRSTDVDRRFWFCGQACLVKEISKRDDYAMPGSPRR